MRLNRLSVFIIEVQYKYCPICKRNYQLSTSDQKQIFLSNTKQYLFCEICSSEFTLLSLIRFYDIVLYFFVLAILVFYWCLAQYL